MKQLHEKPKLMDFKKKNTEDKNVQQKNKNKSAASWYI